MDFRLQIDELRLRVEAAAPVIHITGSIRWRAAPASDEMPHRFRAGRGQGYYRTKVPFYQWGSYWLKGLDNDVELAGV